MTQTTVSTTDLSLFQFFGDRFDQLAWRYIIRNKKFVKLCVLL